MKSTFGFLANHTLCFGFFCCLLHMANKKWFGIVPPPFQNLPTYTFHIKKMPLFYKENAPVRGVGLFLPFWRLVTRFDQCLAYSCKCPCSGRSLSVWKATYSMSWLYKTKKPLIKKTHNSSLKQCSTPVQIISKQKLACGD